MTTVHCADQYLCKYCNEVGKMYNLGKLITCLACKGNCIDVELEETNKKYYVHNLIKPLDK